MVKIMKSGKKFVILVVAVALVVSVFNFIRMSMDEEMEIYEKTLRLHIPANSDSKEDQELKLQVRDAVIELLKDPLSECKTKEDAVRVAEEMSDEIERVSDEVINENGKNYKATVTITEEYYPRRQYEGISLPAGNYTSVKIELGEAEGQNWWCVLFPQVCTQTASADEVLAEVGFTANQIRLLTDQEDCEYVVKFKLLEIIEGIFG